MRKDHDRHLKLNETDLFIKWLELPHPELNIDNLLVSYARSLHQLRKSKKAEVEAMMAEGGMYKDRGLIYRVDSSDTSQWRLTPKLKLKIENETPRPLKRAF